MNDQTPIDLQRRREWRIERPQRQGYMPPPKREVETCPTCKFPLASDTHGWVSTGYDDRLHRTNVIACPMCSGGIEAKRQAQLINDLFGDAHIPWYAKDWGFSTYPKNDANLEAYEDMITFITEKLEGKPGKRGMYLHGSQGLGKTGLAISALQALLRKGHSGVFMTTVELFEILRGAIAASQRMQQGDKRWNDKTQSYEYFQDKYEASQGARLHRLVKSVEWLVLDDLGVEGCTKYVIQQLYLIIEERRSQGLYTIFTSNHDASGLARYWQSKEEGVFQDAGRIIDRLGEYCLVVPLASKNLREKTR
jgi:DNA replication protein DnaC